MSCNMKVMLICWKTFLGVSLPEGPAAKRSWVSALSCNYDMHNCSTYCPAHRTLFELRILFPKEEGAVGTHVESCP